MGEMDDLSIWSRALSDEEILKLSNKTIHIEPNIRYLLGSSYLVSIVLLITVLLLAALFLLRGRSGHRKRNKEDQVREDVMQARPHDNFIGLFGDFRIIDNHGNNIAGQLSPKLKQLFFVLLIFSLKEKNGISTRELSNILWKGQSLKSTKNLRGVTIRNLRKVLETVDRIDIQYQSDNWSLQLGGSVVCDYYVFLKLLENKNIHDYIIFSRFYDLIREGEFLKGESQPWMDEVKGYVGNSIMDVLLQHLQNNSKSLDPGDILTIADLILVYDPVNEVALSYKMKTLVMQNNHNLARFTYKQFCQMYQDMYGEAFNRSFEQMIS
jgi:two-component SAPR family response regulator